MNRVEAMAVLQANLATTREALAVILETSPSRYVVCGLRLDADVCVLPLGHKGDHRTADGTDFNEEPF